ncbi:hypothetical protein [Saguinine gammaherpesvirus 1]|uniref:Tegument protein UL14 n=1 Tax=Saguinine gammaherpesvirus 1 TaxID=2169901 RepID=A0A9Q8QW83_9GAMA|nr:hypothetical protein [Saguinine gammaherpesvirus 1]
MEQTKRENLKKLVCADISAKINKRASVSLFDRFGKDSTIFLKQYEEAQRSMSHLTEIQKQNKITANISNIDRIIKEKSQQLSLLSTYNKDKIYTLQELSDQVSDLTEELRSDIESCVEEEGDGGSGGPYADGGRDGSGLSEEQLSTTIVQWRLETCPLPTSIQRANLN